MSKLLTINGLDKLIGTSFTASGGALMVVDDIMEVLVDGKQEAYCISLRYSIRKTNYPYHLYIFIYRKVFGVEGRTEVRLGGEVCHHRMLRATFSHRARFFESKEFDLPVRYMNEMRVWLDWMGLFENADGWKEETLYG